jgi:hypothetical protein
MRFVLVVLLSSLQVACSLPVAVIGEDGRIYRGTNDTMNGTFFVSGDGVVCRGSYNPLVDSRTISMPVSCSDGRTGVVRATRDTGVSGSGTFRLSDGYTGDFLFGSAAEKL